MARRSRPSSRAPATTPPTSSAPATASASAGPRPPRSSSRPSRPNVTPSPEENLMDKPNDELRVLAPASLKPKLDRIAHLAQRSARDQGYKVSRREALGLGGLALLIAGCGGTTGGGGDASATGAAATTTKAS